eukprot:CAMPEP_0201566820 /NCGR_PEP_ID=MMETSP0190_2-20130828/6909_1 /ASSEMBLY_ACC=CAM_ASM_000263 /TAXON_ID=37353 /ORGANISM="Rosalina sp." /LENGTH=636 /DNA_ID=CAMNT_0047986057 /DNA_START=57 /DNA_END=1964 /DNA_ORIENTATION=+
MNTMSLIPFCLSFILISLRVSSFSTDWSDEFDYNTYIDENQLFKLYWTNLPNDIIEFGIEVSATGWIALGISPRGQMPNSDIALGWVDDDGNAYLQDRYTTGRTTPLYDSNQNLTLISGEEVDGMTRLRWTRPKYSCDGDDMSLSKGTTRLIWAFHSTQDPEEECFDGGSGSITYHTNKGTQSINLDSGVPEEIELEDDVETLDFVMDNVAVPATDTTYYCKLFKVPHFNDTQHMVKFSTIVEEGNEAVVHHIVVYDCPEYVATQDHEVLEGDCDAEHTNMPSRQCRGERIIFVWAVGGNDVYLPEVAGMALSGDSDIHYMLLEMHYDNPLEQEGIIDNSGFRMYYTPTLREMEVGVLTIGLDTNQWGQWIPPGLSYAHNAAFLPSECSENGIPEEGIKVFGSFLHQHTIGKALNMRHIRNGKELAPIDINLDYDFNYQQTIMFEEPIILLPGDEFVLDCYTDSTDREFTTTGGESSSQEMCFAFLLHYPALDMRVSTAGKSPEALKTWMKDAQEAGYMNTDSNIEVIFDSEDPDFSSLSYDGSMDGALEFYNRLYSVEYEEYNQHYLFCAGSEELYNDDYENVPRDESFEKYDLGIDECDNSINVDGEDLVSMCTPTGGVETPNGSEMRSMISGW